MLFVRYSYRQPKSSVPEFRYRALRGINWNLGKEEGVAGVTAFGFRRPKENTRGGGVVEEWMQGAFIARHSEFGFLGRRREEFTLLYVILM